MSSSTEEEYAPKPILVLSHTPAVARKRRRRSRKNKSDSDTVSTTSSNENSNNASPPSPSRRRRRMAKTDSSGLTAEEKSRYIAMDCEMVGVGYCGQRSALARVCLINWYGKKILDVYVRPSDEPVTDYRTFVSGITEEHLESPKAIDYEACREQVMQHLKGKILVGHALKNDLHALGIHHPWYDTRDTGKYEPFMKVRFVDGILWPRKLKELAKEKLGRDVQRPGVAHNPFEDAKTALDLFKLVHRKWEKVMAYKLNKTREIEKVKVMNVTSEPVALLGQ